MGGSPFPASIDTEHCGKSAYRIPKPDLFIALLRRRSFKKINRMRIVANFSKNLPGFCFWKCFWRRLFFPLLWWGDVKISVGNQNTNVFSKISRIFVLQSFSNIGSGFESRWRKYACLIIRSRDAAFTKNIP